MCVKDEVQRKAENELTVCSGWYSTTDRSCVPHLAGIELKVKLDNCRKKSWGRRACALPVPVPVFAGYKEQLSFTDTVTEIPKYCNVKTGLCQERRKRVGTKYSPEDISKIVFLEYVLRLANNCSQLSSNRWH